MWFWGKETMKGCMMTAYSGLHRRLSERIAVGSEGLAGPRNKVRHNMI